jgi:hypothetical protein
MPRKIVTGVHGRRGGGHEWRQEAHRRMEIEANGYGSTN